jgi:hypothetical protein
MVMQRNGRTKGYYLPTELITWLERKAAEQSRSASNYLALLLEREKANDE